MCECDECTPRCTAKGVAVTSIVFSSIGLILLFIVILAVVGAITLVKPPGPGASKEDKANYEKMQAIISLGAAIFVILFLLQLALLGVHVLLYLASSKERVVRDQRQCYIWVIIWLTVSVAAIICGFVMSVMMSNVGESEGYTAPVIQILFIALVIPYAVQLSRPGAVIVQPMQVYPSQAQMQDPNMYNQNPSVGGYPQQVAVAYYPSQQGYPQQGGYSQVGGYPQLQQPMSSPSQPAAQAS